jgi:hypothetical protein
MIEIERFWLQTIRLRQQLLLKIRCTRLFKFGPGTHGSSTNKGEKDIDHKRNFK